LIKSGNIRKFIRKITESSIELEEESTVWFIYQLLLGFHWLALETIQLSTIPSVNQQHLHELKRDSCVDCWWRNSHF